MPNLILTLNDPHRSLAHGKRPVLTPARLADSVVGVYLFRGDNPIYFGSFSRAFVAMFLIIGPPCFSLRCSPAMHWCREF